MSWKSSADGLMKWKKGAEDKLQGFGRKIGAGFKEMRKKNHAKDLEFIRTTKNYPG